VGVVTDPAESVAREVESFCHRHGADPDTVEPSGVANVVGDGTVEEIAAALDELARRENGSA